MTALSSMITDEMMLRVDEALTFLAGKGTIINSTDLFRMLGDGIRHHALGMDSKRVVCEYVSRELQVFRTNGKNDPLWYAGHLRP